VLGAGLLGAALLLGVGVGSGGGPAGKAAPPKEELAKLVAQDAQAIRDTLAKKTRIDKRSARKAKAAALMVALYADAAGLPELRASALKVVKLIEENKGKEAAELAGKLTPDAKGPGAADPVAWEKQLPFEDVMHQFSGTGLGGFGLEKELEELREGKDALTAEQLQRVTLLGYKLAQIARVADAYADERAEGGKKTKDNWLRFSAQFRKTSLDLAQAARARDQAATRTALDRLDTSCTKCHDVFR
jgi:hypothetical protein